MEEHRGREHSDTLQPWKSKTRITLSQERWEDMFNSYHVKEARGIEPLTASDFSHAERNSFVSIERGMV